MTTNRSHHGLFSGAAVLLCAVLASAAASAQIRYTQAKTKYAEDCFHQCIGDTSYCETVSYWLDGRPPPIDDVLNQCRRRAEFRIVPCNYACLKHYPKKPPWWHFW